MLNGSDVESTFHPTRDLVLVELSTTTRTYTIAGPNGPIDLIVSRNVSYEQPYGRIVATGPDVAHVCVGNAVLLDQSACIRIGSGDVLRVGSAARGNSISNNGPGRVLIAEADVLAIMEDDE